MKFKDYYQTLGVARTATQDDIKKAYRRLARKYHPDVSKESDAETRFKEVGEAYEVLRDPEKRAAYDRFGKDWKAGQEFRPPPDWDQSFSFDGGGFTDNAEFSDFFESLFGHGSHRRRGTGFHTRGNDVQVRLQLSLDEAYRGVERPMTLTIPEMDANGQVRNTNRTLNVKIPKGVINGQRVRLPGQGGGGMGEGPAGDLFIVVDLAPHPYFRAENRDIYLELPVMPWEAALGTKVKIPTLGGKVDLTIPPGAKSGQKFRLKGRGLPGNPPGDQYAVLQIVVPEAKSREAKELFQRMKETMPMNPRSRLGV